MDDALLTTVLSRLDADEALDAEAGLLVLAACQDELDTTARRAGAPA